MTVAFRQLSDNLETWTACQYNIQVVDGNTYTLREIHMYPVVVNKHPLHLEVGLFAVLLVFELDKRILQTIARALVPNHLAGQNGPKATEDQIEILV